MVSEGMTADRARDLASLYKGFADTLRQDGYSREAEGSVSV